jgi:hypothetical protein
LYAQALSGLQQQEFRNIRLDAQLARRTKNKFFRCVYKRTMKLDGTAGSTAYRVSSQHKPTDDTDPQVN